MATPCPCPFPWSYAMLYPDGHVQPCCYNGRDMGNINARDFAAVWNGAEYRDLRRRLLAGDYQGAGCGDPFAYKENLEILRALTDEQAKHVSLEFYTNGALIDRHWDLLDRFDNIFLVVSLHSLVNDVYKRIMGTKDPVDRAVRNIDRFVERARAKPNWRLSLTNIVMKSTVEEVANLARFAIERNAAVSFVHMHGQHDPGENIYDRPELVTRPSRFRRQIAEAIALLDAAGHTYRTAVDNLRYIERLFCAAQRQAWRDRPLAMLRRRLAVN